tara:strand:+ start:4272 stop:5708 length:1437 start_codon:yes stop_codon:yes gene_type:complete
VTEESSEKLALSFRDRKWLVWLLVAIDILVLEFCLALGFGVRVAVSDWIPYAYDAQTFIGLATGVLIVPVTLLLSGVYPGYGMNDVERMRRVVTMTTVVFASLIGWDYLVQQGQWSRGVLLATWAIAIVLLPLVFGATRRLFVRSGIWGTPLLLIGARGAAEQLIQIIARDDKIGYTPIGILDFDSALVGTDIDGVPVIGTVKDADWWARRIKTAAVAMPELNGDQIAELCAKLPFPQVLILPEFRELQTSWVTPRDMNGVLVLDVKKNLLLRRNSMIKRIADLVLGSFLLAFSLPLLVFACAAIMLISPGPPFYRHEVAGRGKRPFSMLKIRTMHPKSKDRLQRFLDENPERRVEWLRNFKLRDDPRIIPFVGAFLRRSSIDELPQLLNVLRGEMSLVGPRPLAVYELEWVDPDYVNLRCSVPPGITGLWQVEKRSQGSVDDREKLDTYYIRNWSLWLDVYILFRTFPAVVSAKGAF